MPQKIKRIKTFVCFYLTLPLFVLLVLAAGINISVTDSEAASADISTITEESAEALARIDVEITNPDGSYPIIARNLSKDYNILNDTDTAIDEDRLLSISLPHKSTSPTVLVVHTHATECYADTSESFGSADAEGNWGYYTQSSKTRTEDTGKNMIAIGEVFCAVLAENGISAIQCRILHDKDDYNSAYENSRASIKEYLEKYPSIEYVIDIHRDSLGGSGKEKTKTLCEEIERCAQVMMVAGCHGKGVNYPDWEKNLSLALKYKEAMDEKYPSLSRPIYLRHSRYNLDLKVGSMLLEVGSCANTFDEASRAASLAAECFAELIK